MENSVININPNILGGEPVFMGTRVPIKAMFDYLEAGDTLEVFLDDFDSVTKEQTLALMTIARKVLMQSLPVPHEDIV